MWFKDTFEIGAVDEAGHEVVNFACVSKNALELFLSSKISGAQASINGISRMWKIYQSHTSEYFKTVFRMFTTLSPRFSLGALTFPLNDWPKKGRKIFDLQGQNLASSARFGIGLSKSR